MTHIYQHKQPFKVESGATLPGITISYHTYGFLNNSGDNVIWICHALTADSNVQSWWPKLVGARALFDTQKYFVVCANILGSCYGSTGPLSINPVSETPFLNAFPLLTIRDMVNAHALLAQHLAIKKIHLLAGGSMGGYQALEWCVMQPHFINRLFLIATSARESAWGIAVHAAQRLAIEADETFKNNTSEGGKKGLKAARAIGMLTYRNYETYKATQADEDHEKLDYFKASSYINYQGEKLSARFNAHSYWLLTKGMDSHNVARGRAASVEEVVKTIRQTTFVMGINSDLLCPLAEQEMLADIIPNNQFKAINSLYGHDGFLIEVDSINLHVGKWLSEKP